MIITVDFANGPSWPIADIHATSPDDQSVIRELAYGLKVLAPGEHFEGEIPKPATDKATPYQRLISLALDRISGENEIDIDDLKEEDLEVVLERLVNPEDVY